MRKPFQLQPDYLRYRGSDSRQMPVHKQAIQLYESLFSDGSYQTII